MNFMDIGIDEKLSKCLEKSGITTPTYIQEKSIPEILKGNEVIAKSETGSGKTLAYLLPIYNMVDGTQRTTQAIILTPTHELAIQVHKEAQILSEGEGVNVRVALIIGGANIIRQMDKLKEKPQVIIGSAGRILDLIKKKKIQAHTCETIVIDEADRMLEKINIEDIKGIIKTTLQSKRKIHLFSASIGVETKAVAKEIMGENPSVIEKEDCILPKEIKHFCIMVEKRDKIVVLRKIIAGLKPRRTIVFINDPDKIEVMVEKLKYHSLKAGGIYGAAHKEQRKTVMNAFLEGRIDILVASDIGARGLDFERIDVVVNLDISEESVYYQHRAGRTGRNGSEGIVISIAEPYEKKILSKYEREFGIKITEKVMALGKLSNPEVQKSKNIRKREK